jgi:hypothetical protein
MCLGSRREYDRSFSRLLRNSLFRLFGRWGGSSFARRLGVIVVFVFFLLLAGSFGC